MSHIHGQLTWTEGVFHRAYKESDRLVLELADGTKRDMNLDWQGVDVTEQKIFALKQEMRIRIATWADYPTDKWFCDVEEIK